MQQRCSTSVRCSGAVPVEFQRSTRAVQVQYLCSICVVPVLYHCSTADPGLPISERSFARPSPRISRRSHAHPQLVAKATAFAALARLGACASKPGIYGAVGSTCNYYDFQSPPCLPAGFYVPLGAVVVDQVSGGAASMYAATVKPSVEGGRFAPGILFSVHAMSAADTRLQD